MTHLKLIGIVLVIAAPVAAIFLQSRWRLLSTQRPAQIVATSTTTEAEGTIVHTTEAVGYPARIRWSLVLLLVAVFLAGVVCLFLARSGGTSI